MNFDAVMIRNQQPLIVRMLRELSDNTVHSLAKARCFVTTAGLSCFRTKRLDDDQEGMFRSALLREDDAPFHMRLAHELVEASRALLSDPVAFVKDIAGRRVVSGERRKQLRAGVSVAGLVYLLALSTMYAAYTIAHRNHSNTETQSQTRVILLAPLPRVALTAPQPIKTQGGGGSSKNQLTPLKLPVSEPSSLRLEFRPLDQISPNPKPEVMRAETPPQPVGGSTAAGSSGTGTGGGVGSGEGAGVGSGRGPGAGSNENVDYSGVFSVGNITIRPQITARPAAAYTDEERRAQVEGSVKVSVVLKADGTVSDARVVRGLGYGLDEHVIEAARHLRFVPAQKDGRPVSVRLSLEFRFSLL